MNLNECLYRIKNPAYVDLITTMYEKYNISEKAKKDACKVTTILDFLLSNDHLKSNPYVTDIIYTASMLHNIKYKYGIDKWQKIFAIRDYIEETINENEEKFGERIISRTCITSLESTIEQQLGKDTPNEILIPNPSTPGYYLSLACALHYKFK